VLFADVRGFTALVEPLPPAQALKVLNLYLETMAAAVRQHGGMVDKYLGDGLMAVFGALVPVDNAAAAAVACARAMQEGIRRLTPPAGVQQLPSIGVGIHAGEAVLGTVGGRERLEYTALGDAVNVAARLEEIARPGAVLITEEVLQRLPAAHPARAQATWLGTTWLRGRQRPVELYELT
jgi:adenylate cyclase